MPVRVQYATTADGLRIAFAVDGSGHPLVYMAPLPFRHVELEWQLTEDRRWLERLGGRYRVVRYDPRGLGLSDRNASQWTVDALVRDLAAVVDAVDAGPVALFACLNTAPIAIDYAVRHPDRVSHLILWCAVARMADALPPQVVTLLDLADKDWELFTEAVAHVMVGWSAGEAAHRYAEFLRACVTADVARTLIQSLATADVTAMLAAVRTPTLVLHRRGVQSVPLPRATELAAGIPGARLIVLEGDVMRPGVGDMDEAMQAVTRFVPSRDAGDADDAGRHAEPVEPSTNVFRREGEYWTLAFDGRMCRVRDVKGLHHIARLLRDPEQQLTPIELLADLEPAMAATSQAPVSDTDVRASLGDAGPILDAQAKAGYRARLADLREELADAERCNDLARAERARTEIEFVARELAGAVGLGGRDRKAASAGERARVTVTKRIKDAIARIAASHPSLADHFGTAIKTGQLCAYAPDPAQRVHWSF